MDQKKKVNLSGNLLKKTPLTLALLAAALIGGLGLRILPLTGKRVMGMDEGLSYLAATGHQGEYHRIRGGKIYPWGSWTRGADWKRLVRTGDPFCFRTISRDLARYDVHPPLYFMLLRG